MTIIWIMIIIILLLYCVVHDIMHVIINIHFQYVLNNQELKLAVVGVISFGLHPNYEM